MKEFVSYFLQCDLLYLKPKFILVLYYCLDPQRLLCKLSTRCFCHYLLSVGGSGSGSWAGKAIGFHPAWAKAIKVCINKTIGFMFAGINMLSAWLRLTAQTKMSTNKGSKYRYAQEHKLYIYCYHLGGRWENKSFKKNGNNEIWGILLSPTL